MTNKEVIQFLKDMPEIKWIEFKTFKPQEAEYILWLIKTQKGCLFETNGTHSKQESITKFRKLPQF